MSVTTHTFPKAQQALASGSLDLATDSLYVLLIATGTFTWGATPETYALVSDFLAGDGTNGALVESTGTAYARQALTTLVLSSSGEVTKLAVDSPVWAASTISAAYALFYDSGAGADGASDLDATTNVPLCYWDFAADSDASSSGAFTLTVSGSGLLTWTSS